MKELKSKQKQILLLKTLPDDQIPLHVCQMKERRNNFLSSPSETVLTGCEGEPCVFSELFLPSEMRKVWIAVKAESSRLEQKPLK